MKPALLVWGLILLVGLGWASPYALSHGLLTEAQLWMAWAVIFLIGSFAVGKTMKKMPKETGMVWASTTVFGLIATFAIALGYLAAPLSALMGLWLVLFGAVIWKAGTKDSLSSTSGVILALIGLVLPGWFAAAPGGYWVAGALFLGLWTIFHSLAAKE